MLPLNNSFLLIVLIFASTNLNAKFFNIDITFESGLFLESQKNFVSEIKTIESKKELEELLLSQDWIDSYSLKFKPFSDEATLSILNRKPIFILNSEFYVDKNLKLFKFDGTITNLIHVKGPLNDMSIIVSIINAIEKENNKDEFFIVKTISYNHTIGWKIKTNKFEIKLGKNVSSSKFKSLKDTLNYLYDKRKIPTMIDLRYKDGVALSYG